MTDPNAEQKPTPSTEPTSEQAAPQETQDEQLPQEKENPTMSLIYWGGIAVALLGLGIYCVIDGWFKPGYEHADFNKLISVPVILGSVWCLWKGFKERRAVEARNAEIDARAAAEEQGEQ